MNRIATGLAGDLDHFTDGKVGLDRTQAFADAVTFVGLETVKGKLVFVGIDGDGAQAQFVGGSENPNSNFAPVGDEDFFYNDYDHPGMFWIFRRRLTFRPTVKSNE